MKKLISLLLCLLLLTGCAETYDGPTESKAVLSSIQTTYYDPTGGDSQYSRTDYAYDIYGNQVMELEYGIRSHDEEAEPTSRPYAPLTKTQTVPASGSTLCPA